MKRRVCYLRRRTTILASLALAFALSPLASSQHTERDWPVWRGVNMDLTATRTKKLQPGGNYRLNVVWKRPLGSGYSGISVVDGVAVTMFADATSDYVAAFDAESGEELWRSRLGPRYPGHWGSQDGPISTPMIADGRVFVLDTSGQFFSFDFATGQELWSLDLPEDRESVVPFYGFATAPIPFGDTVILETGGPKGRAVTAFEAASGNVRWTAGHDSIDYQSPLLTTVEGRPLLLGIGNEKMLGLDPASGKLLWTVEHGGDTRDIGSRSTNIVKGSGDHVFINNHHGSSKLFELNGGDQPGAREVWQSRYIKNTYVVPVYHEGYFYGYNSRILSAVSEEEGELVWKSRPPGDGFPILLDGHLVIVTKDGDLSMAPASPEGYNEIARVHLFDDLVWTPASFANESLYLRSMGEWARVDVVEVDERMTLDREQQGAISESEFGRFIASVEASDQKTILLDEFLASQRQFPIVEGTDMVHFVYRGLGEDMALFSDLFGGRTDRPMNRVEETDFFYYSVRLESDARVDYGFIQDFDTRLQDPRNPMETLVFYEDTMSYVAMPEWVAPIHLDEPPAESRGRLEEIALKSRYLDMGLPLKIYLPPGYQPDREYPVAYVHNGNQAIQLGRLTNTLDNLSGHSIEPILVIFIPIPGERDDGGYNFRTFYQTYSGAQKDLYERMLVEEIVPLVEGRYPVSDGAGSRALVGTEHTAFMSFYTAVKHPGMFGKLGLQSIVWERGYREQNSALMSSPGRQPLTIYLDWTKYDAKSEKEGWDARGDGLAFADVLEQKGYAYVGGEFHDGSGWSSWRNRTHLMLQTLFPKDEGTESES